MQLLIILMILHLDYVLDTLEVLKVIFIYK